MSQKLLTKIINAGRYAPSGGNSQSNHFMVVANKTIKDELIKMTEKALSEMEYDEHTYKSLKKSIILSKRAVILSVIMPQYSLLLPIRKTIVIIRLIVP